ncbi:MAG: nucleotidyltransferase [Thermoanaerobaculia bacterium]|nr:nucleotidyltransferase [Thermoanaerobaculia bacterium]
MALSLTSDMRDLLEIFKSRKVEYVVVGGFAVNFYGYVRNTQDLDVLVFPSVKNAGRVMQALEEFGFGDAGIPQELFERRGSAIHLGVEPNRIDLLTKLEGVDTEQIRHGVRQVDLDGCRVRMVSLEVLLEAKRRSSRAKDQADVEELERARAGLGT